MTIAEKNASAVCLSWHDITYDIPLTKKASKESANHRTTWSGEGNAESLSAGLEEGNVFDAAKGGLSGPPGHRRILFGMSGSVRRGEMVAILGASGAGKTTLLNVLSARLSKFGTLSGSVLYNGAPRNPSSWKRTVGFVEQEDLMIGLLTVYEQLYFSAKMRLPNGLYENSAKKSRVEDIIQMLRLEKCRDTRIGDARTRGVSGGEKKRTSIGIVSLITRTESECGLAGQP